MRGKFGNSLFWQTPVALYCVVNTSHLVKGLINWWSMWHALQIAALYFLSNAPCIYMRCIKWIYYFGLLFIMLIMLLFFFLVRQLLTCPTILMQLHSAVHPTVSPVFWLCSDEIIKFNSARSKHLMYYKSSIMNIALHSIELDFIIIGSSLLLLAYIINCYRAVVSSSLHMHI